MQTVIVQRLALTVWCGLCWLLLDPTVTVETVVVGVVAAIGCSLALWPLAGVLGPWSLLRPGRLAAAARLLVTATVRELRANLHLARLVWSPHPPLQTGMVLIDTAAWTPREAGLLGLVTSMVVDNQLVDLDVGSQTMLFHCVSVPPPTRAQQLIFGPLQPATLDLVNPDRARSPRP